MKNLKFYRFVLLLLSCLPVTLVQSQDPDYTQIFNNPVYYNPAFTGLNKGMRIRFNYRDQWPNLPVDFTSYSFSAEMGDRNLPGAGGIGIIINSDNEGIGFINNFVLGANFSVRIPITENVVSQLGIKAAFVQRKVNWDDFVFTDELSARYGVVNMSAFQRPENNTRMFPDFSVGGLFNFSGEYSNVTGTAGFAVDHLFEPDESFLSTGKAPLPRKYVLHTNLIITASEGYRDNSTRGFNSAWKFNPGITYQSQNKMSSIEAGLNILKYNCYVGAWVKSSLMYESTTALALLAGYRYYFAEDMNIRFMYSYDIQIAGEAQSAGGAHEVSIVLEFENLSFSGKNEGYNYRRKNSQMEFKSF